MSRDQPSFTAMPTYYLHVESDQPMVGSTKHLYFFERKLDKNNYNDFVNFITPIMEYGSYETEYSEPHRKNYAYQKYLPKHPLGRYIIMPKRCKYRMCENTGYVPPGIEPERYVFTGTVATKLQTCGYDWRGREVMLLGKYQALILHPNESAYWRALIRKVLRNPDKYPPLQGVDKMLFALCWHHSRLFWADPRKCGSQGWLMKDMKFTKTGPMPQFEIPPDPAIYYTREHYADLWLHTRDLALSSDDPGV